MKKLMMIVMGVGLMGLVGCGTETKADTSSDCSKAPKLTKSCLNSGTWTMAGSLKTKLTPFLIAGTSFPLDVEDSTESYQLSFSVADANKNSPTATDHVSFKKVGSDPSDITSGTFSLSPDSTTILFVFNDGGARDGTADNITATVAKDSTFGAVLRFEKYKSSNNGNGPFFAVGLTGGTKVAELFYRAKAK